MCRFERSALVAASLSALLLGACNAGAISSPSADATASPVARASATDARPDGPITVQLRDFSFKLSSASAPSGDVTFEMKNLGDVPHDFVLIRTNLDAADLPHLTEDLKVNEDGLDIVYELKDLKTGESANPTVNLEAGHYVVICNISGHYDGGMRVDFEVN